MLEGDLRMGMPNKQEIMQKARELYARDCYKRGCPDLANVNPEDYELAQNGFTAVARSELMRDTSKAENSHWSGYNENLENSDDLKFNLEEAMKSGVLVSGTTGTGKSDVGMYLTDQLMNEGIIVVVFDSSQDWQKRSSIARYQTLAIPHIDTVPERSVIFDISRLSVEQRQKLIENFSQTLYQRQAMNPSRRQYFLIFEEGSSYFREGFMRGKRFSNTAMLMSEGRNYGVRFMVITQFFASIDKMSMRYMRQRYFGYTDELNDVSYVKAFLGDQASKLRDLSAGQFIYYNAGRTTKISIEPYTSTTPKISIQQPDTPAILKPNAQPRARTYDPTIAIARLILMAIFCALMAKVFI
jgi:hypothetical protein